MTAVRFCDESDVTLGWIHPDPDWMARAGHAVLAGGGVWVLDPVDGEGVEERIRELGEPAGVVRLLDRHSRDCAGLAERLGVPLHSEPFDGVPGAPFEVISVLRTPLWKEVALWFPAEHVLACGDALANADGYKAPSETVGVHPMLRALPPKQLRGRPVEHLLLGHGEGVHGPQAAEAIDAALDGAWRGVPGWGVRQVRRLVGR